MLHSSKNHRMPEHHRRLAALLGALTALGPLGVDMYLPAFPAMGLALAATPAEMQQTLATFLLGMAAGQLVYGPLSDRLGRRVPLFLGMAVFTAASVGCALATSAQALVWLRLAQALGACVGLVVARAVVRDVCDERGAVRMMSMLMLAMGAAPILAPMLGSWFLAAFGWRAIFWFLAGYGVLAMLVMRVWLPESLAPELRRRDGPGQILLVYLTLLRDRRFLSHALAGALPMAGLFAYLVGSPHLLMDQHGLGPGEYGLAFGGNAFGLILASQIISRLVRRGGVPARLLVVTLCLLASAGVMVLLAVLSGALLPLLAAFFLFLALMGSVLPLSSALAMAPMGRMAGSASALMGTLQFGLGALVGAALGAVGGASTTAMGLLIACAGLSGLVAHLVLRRTA
jgi:DHA1 family bicyclomycin/chloramphenicol resistance-like MFS transporter